ncbi:MAG: lipopolysaccharide transport periplasmic protein LptA [Pseudomonadota bacterium]|jgi:lipopolysaccharide export system protein LptA
MKYYTTALTLLLALSTPTYAENKPTGSMTNLMDSQAFDDSFGKLPTNITSDSLSFNAKDRVFAYSGNVQVTQGDMRLTSKTLEGTYSEKNELLKLIAKGDVFISKQDIQATGQTASYDAVASIVTLSDNPQLQQKESILRADKIKIFLNENRSQAEGDVRVTFVNSKDGNPGLPSLNPVAAQPSPQPTATPAAPKKAASAPAKAKKK